MDKKLDLFLKRMRGNKQMRATHISLYAALLFVWFLNCSKNPLPIDRQDLMRRSKIKSRGTYHKCIKDLASFGCIQYFPSFNAAEKKQGQGVSGELRVSVVHGPAHGSAPGFFLCFS